MGRARRLTVARNGQAQERTVALAACRDDVLRAARNKLQIRRAQRVFVLHTGAEITTDEQLLALMDDTVVAVSAGEDFVGVVADAASSNITPPTAAVTILAKRSWLEDEATQQLTRTAQLPGIVLAAGMPDLHPGKGYPVGAAFASRGLIYPALIGNDIGCGMALYHTALPADERSPARLAQQLRGLEGPWQGDRAAWLSRFGVAPTPCDESLGTIGGGNHFAELQAVHHVVNADVFVDQLGLSATDLYLLVHSGSRSLGATVLDQVLTAHGTAGLPESSDAAQMYLNQHDTACRWALANRELIAHRVLGCMGDVQATKVLDIWHNNVTRKSFPAQDDVLWLHRKGAAPSDSGVLVIPGSRGHLSYLLMPTGSQHDNAFSLAHGAGRKWNRSKALQKNRERFHAPEMLTETAFGSVVVCEDKQLLYEEAPEAYKDIDDIIADMRDAGLVDLIAILRPVVTYKMRSEH